MQKKSLSLASILLLFTLTSFRTTSEISWQELDTGLFYAEYAAPQKSFTGDSKINLLKIDPKHHEFVLASAKEPGETILTAPQWAQKKKLLAVINAGMYQMDFKTNVGYMKNFAHTNNPRLNKDNTILAFNRKDSSVPEIQIIDRTCQDWEVLKDQYSSFTQSIRMVDCKQQNRWSQQPKKWSMVAIGMDSSGNVLFAFSRSPYTVHDFIDILLEAPMNLYNLMYLEGGPEASFYVKHGDTEVTKFGSYETGFVENDGNDHFWPIPNVIGVRRKEGK